jgi:hypothetical protein
MVQKSCQATGVDNFDPVLEILPCHHVYFALYPVKSIEHAQDMQRVRENLKATNSGKLKQFNIQN